MTTIEQKLTQALGELQFHNIVLAHNLEVAHERLAELEALVQAQPELHNRENEEQPL